MTIYENSTLAAINSIMHGRGGASILFDNCVFINIVMSLIGSDLYLIWMKGIQNQNLSIRGGGGMHQSNFSWHIFVDMKVNDNIKQICLLFASYVRQIQFEEITDSQILNIKEENYDNLKSELS